MPSSVRDYLNENPWIDGMAEKTLEGHLRYVQLNKEGKDKLKGFMNEFTDQSNRVGSPSVFKKIVRTIFEGSFGFDIDPNRLEKQVQDLQGDFIKQAMYGQVVDAAQGKPIIITETGWPSQGGGLKGAIAGPESAMKYFIDAIRWTKENDIPIYYFSSFDESWKVGPEGEVGAYWGLWDKHEQLKF